MVNVRFKSVTEEFKKEKDLPALGGFIGGERGDGIMTEEVVVTCVDPRPAAAAPWERVANVNPHSVSTPGLLNQTRREEAQQFALTSMPRC